ncbi:FUSC family protein [Phyllobacterium leguminum]|uniref:Fusaric acid resistance family protein n=1 Tax=Phyllobacterium leguminum TaxID=314237 RepID=A0A318T908_9HYPH|nr:FUSC family protein [Phyllobacterium leguminum]PYE89948.1 fusaric acid resistance family protein [Phyllobacterium leguminum]
MQAIALPEITWRPLFRTTLVVAPFVLLSLVLNNPLWIDVALVAICIQIAWERTELAPLGVLLHGLAIAVGFLFLFLSLLFQPLFVLGCALMSAATIRMAAEGSKLRTLGNFTFIPALYLACEMTERLPRDLYWPTATAFLPYIAIAIIPTMVQSVVDHWHTKKADGLRHFMRHFMRLTKNDPFGDHVPYLEDMAAVILAVGTAAFLVEWGHLDHGQWVIWSAASVVTGDTASSRLKLRDRTIGALAGVPLGILAGLAIPHSETTYGVVILGVFLTLTAFRSYVVGFGVRCGLVSLAIMLAGQSVSVASERIVNVILGGVIGALFVLAAHLAAQHLKPARKI